MLASRILLALAMLHCGAVRAGEGPARPVHLEPCTCIETGTIDDDLAWVYVDGVSFRAPAEAVREDIDSPDSTEVRWRARDLTVSYTGLVTRRWVDPDRVPPEGCWTTVNGHLVNRVDELHLSQTSDVPDATRLVAVWNDPDPRLGMHAAAVESASLESSCEVLSQIVASLQFTNEWNRIRVLAIDPSAGTILIENEVGMHMHVGPKQRFTRHHGVIRELDVDRVLVVEMIPDGAGGWVELERELLLNGANVE